MHIKSFLKKIAELPNNVQNSHPTRFDFLQQSRRKSQTALLHQSRLFCDKSMKTQYKNTELIVKYVDKQHPAIKARLLPTRQATATPDSSPRKNFREKVEDKLMELMTQHKDPIVTKVGKRKKSAASLHYSSQKELSSEKSQKKIPEYVKNIMKPCKIESINITYRPRSALRPQIRSEPKIYCKQLLPSREKSRTHTAEVRSLRRAEGDFGVKFSGWENTHNEQSGELWTT